MKKIVCIIALALLLLTGCSSQSRSPQTSPQTDSDGTDGGGSYVANINSGKLHNLDHAACQNYVNMMNEENKDFYDSEEEANNDGYYACLKC